VVDEAVQITAEFILDAEEPVPLRIDAQQRTA
jgi:hypothetical protein